ncbi:hypothetical protein BDR04DRAFT_145406 [Suillus decipiens]|nr:hypothetical protein BDR04DRAFT_145406 [Suillus decipiens]
MMQTPTLFHALISHALRSQFRVWVSLANKVTQKNVQPHSWTSKRLTSSRRGPPSFQPSEIFVCDVVMTRCNRLDFYCGQGYSRRTSNDPSTVFEECCIHDARQPPKVRFASFAVSGTPGRQSDRRSAEFDIDNDHAFWTSLQILCVVSSASFLLIIQLFQYMCHLSVPTVIRSILFL